MSAKLKVKVLSKFPPGEFLRYFRDPAVPEQDGVTFTFDRDDRHYDFLVVYDDQAKVGNERFSVAREALQCAPQNTLLLTAEPPTIKEYDRHYVAQYGHVLTAQPAADLPHPSRIYSQPAMIWFYGSSASGYRSVAEIAASDPRKTGDVSIVGSNKQERFTAHYQRYSLIQALRAGVPELDVFGKGIRPMDDKAEAIDSFRYHVAIENYIGAHHWTEKLADTFLGLTMPIYAGAPNAADYFPEDSFVAIDIDDHQGSVETVKKVLQDKLYEQRLPAIREARRRVLEDYNFIATVANIAKQRYDADAPRGGELLSRRAMKKRHPLWSAYRALYFKGSRLLRFI